MINTTLSSCLPLIQVLGQTPCEAKAGLGLDIWITRIIDIAPLVMGILMYFLARQTLSNSEKQFKTRLYADFIVAGSQKWITDFKIAISAFLGNYSASHMMDDNPNLYDHARDTSEKKHLLILLLDKENTLQEQLINKVEELMGIKGRAEAGNDKRKAIIREIYDLTRKIIEEKKDEIKDGLS